MSDFNYIDMSTSPYFSPQIEGDGSQTLGAGDGSDWMAWEKFLSPEQYSSFMGPQPRASEMAGGLRAFNPGAFKDWMTNNNYSLKERTDAPDFWTRGVFDASGKPVSGLQSGTNKGDELAFGLAAMFLNPFGGLAAGGSAGGLGGTLANTARGASAINSMATGALTAAGSGGGIGDAIRGAAAGGLAGGYTPDIAGMTGLGNGTLGQIINGAAKGGIQGALSGGGTRGATGGAVQGGVFAGLNSLGGDNMDNPFGDYSRVPGTSDTSMFTDVQQSNVPYGSPIGSFSPGAVGLDREASSGDFWNTNPLGKFMSETWQSPQKLGDLAQGALGMYSGYRRQRMAKEMMNRMGGNRDSYLANLRNQLRAKDAQAGRRSNYAGRETQLQASLAELDARNAPAMSQLSDARFGGLEQLFASGLRMGGNMGMFGPSYTRPGQPQMPQYQPQAPLATDFSLDPQRRTRLGY